MKTIFIYSENSRTPHELEITEGTSVQDILVHHHGGVDDNATGYHLFKEDEEHACTNEKGGKPEFHDKDRVHCHRCQHIDVVFIYNGQQKQGSFNPATTGAKLLAQLPKYFPGITPKDAANLRLEISKGVFIEKNDHLGSFVQYPHCHLEIHLVSKTNVQG